MRIGVLTSVGQTVDAFFPPLIDRWQKQGHDVVTAASTSSGVPGHTIIRSLTRNPSFRNFRAPMDIATWAEEQKIDVLITNTATASFLARVRRMPVPVIYFCHGLHWNEAEGISNRVWQAIENFALRRTDAVMVINSDDETWFRRRLASDDVHRLPGGVGVPIQNFPRSPIPAVGAAVHLLWAGEFSQRKRPWLAVEVVHTLLSKNVPVHLTMCGDGPLMAETRELITKLDVAEAISLVGQTPDVPNFLSDSHALLMTSAWEGLPRIGLESLAIGRPVFAFDVKGTRSLPGVILAPEKAVDDLAQLIGEHAKSGFSDIDFVDPMELHPDRVADGIADVAARLVGVAIRP